MIRDRLMILGLAGLTAVAAGGWLRQPAPSPVAEAAGFQPLPQIEAQSPPALATAPVVELARNHRQHAEPVARRARPAEVVYDDRAVKVEKTRSTKESAAIIGGGAAAGAAIGAIAGGGKGAIIGAASGAGAGLIYDRVTRKSEEPAIREVRSHEEGRSTGKSAAIIGGGAAAGAAIGAAAGGGKGAAIGAIGGGAAGYVYDRMTRNK